MPGDIVKYHPAAMNSDSELMIIHQNFQYLKMSKATTSDPKFLGSPWIELRDAVINRSFLTNDTICLAVERLAFSSRLILCIFEEKVVVVCTHEIELLELNKLLPDYETRLTNKISELTNRKNEQIKNILLKKIEGYKI